MPTTGTSISLSSFLIKIKPDINQKPSFEVELNNIAYLGHPSGSSSIVSHCTIHITSLYQDLSHRIIPISKVQLHH